MTEICRRVDGLPLAIELAAARVRALSLAEILDGLHDRFRLLTGGARTAVRRQQTLRASVDWSHALLSEPERVLFRRLAVFMGGFDLDAAQAVAGAGEVERYQILDQLTLLVDKSLVVADDSGGRTRYRLLETVRQYALEKLGQSGEADTVRARHRDHYTALAALLDTPAGAAHERRIEQAEIEIDNLRAAFAWSRENSYTETALALASSLQHLWVGRGRIREGLAWFNAARTVENARNPGVAPAIRARALADKAMLGAWVGAPDSIDQAEQALAIARDVEDPGLLAWALAARGFIAAFTAQSARPYFAEAVDLARATGDRWRLGQILGWQAYAALTVGDPVVARTAAEEGRDVADAIGDRSVSRQCRFCLGWAQMWQGELGAAVAQFDAMVAEAEAAHDVIWAVAGLGGLGFALTYQGDMSRARATAAAALEAGGELGLGVWHAGIGYVALALTALASGDVATGRHASEEASPYVSYQPQTAAINSALMANAALARADLSAARRWAEDAVAATTGWRRSYQAMQALITRARVGIAQGERQLAERDAYDALAHCADLQAYLFVPDILECLAGLAVDIDSQQEAARLFGAADGIRQRIGAVRFQINEAGHKALVAALRNAMGENDFDAAWAEGAALSVDEAIAYAQRWGPR